MSTTAHEEVQPFTLTEIADREADYLRAAMALDWRRRRRTRRDIADAAFLRLIATVRMFATGCVGLAAQLSEVSVTRSGQRASVEGGE